MRRPPVLPCKGNSAYLRRICLTKKPQVLTGKQKKIEIFITDVYSIFSDMLSLNVGRP